MSERPCRRCGHPTAGTRKVKPDLCGPCSLPWTVGKPAKLVGWWTGIERHTRRGSGRQW